MIPTYCQTTEFLLPFLKIPVLAHSTLTAHLHTIKLPNTFEPLPPSIFSLPNLPQHGGTGLASLSLEYERCVLRHTELVLLFLILLLLLL